MKLSHYHMFATKVIFVKNEDTGAAELNVIVVTDDGLVGSKELKKAQDNAYLQFRKLTGDADAQIIDVFIQSVSHLGKMKQDRFHNLPKDQQTEAPAEAEKTDLSKLFPGLGHE